MVNSREFIKRLEEILEYYGLSAAAFAEKLEFNRSTISHLLSGRNKPSLEFVVKLLQKFPEVNLDWLLFGKGTFPVSSETAVATTSKNQKPNTGSEVSQNLFTETNGEIGQKSPQITHPSETIEKIVIFYSDGSFKVYQN